MPRAFLGLLVTFTFHPGPFQAEIAQKETRTFLVKFISEPREAGQALQPTQGYEKSLLFEPLAALSSLNPNSLGGLQDGTANPTETPLNLTAWTGRGA